MLDCFKFGPRRGMLFKGVSPASLVSGLFPLAECLPALTSSRTSSLSLGAIECHTERFTQRQNFVARKGNFDTNAAAMAIL